jgi:uncharacterized protein YqgV (UPF0045/DUF77 family)
MARVNSCHEVLHQTGALRITCYIKLGIRTDRDQTMPDEVTIVQNKLADE